MSEQASLHLCNLAGMYGLPEARKMLGFSESATEPVTAAKTETKKPAVVPVKPPVPVVPTEPAQPPAEFSPEAQAQAQRDAENEGAKTASVADLKAALDQLGIPYAKNAKKADLLALFLARP